MSFNIRSLDYISNSNPQFIGRIWVVSIGVKEKPFIREGIIN